MKKKWLCLPLASVLAASALTTLAACGGGKQQNDPESRPFVMSTQAPDGVFNPFFSSSQYDSNIISWTQIGMFTTDKNGNIVCGEDEMSVVKAYSSTYDANESNGVDNAQYKGVTTYQMAIKNGIKFSDGEPLTIKDVLFNLYVYLDPNYTGSSTLYSTQILGLEAYRTQNPDATQGSMEGLEEQFTGTAQQRVRNLYNYVNFKSRHTLETEKSDPNLTEEQEAQAKEDYLYTKKEFRKELERDWNTTLSSMETYVKWGFTEPWQAFMYLDGGQSLLKTTTPGGSVLAKDEEGNYIFDADGDTAKTLAADLAEYLEAHEGEDTTDNLTREWALVSAFYQGGFDTDYDDDTNVDAQIRNTKASDFYVLIYYWQGTSDALMTQFTSDARTEYFETRSGAVKSVSGITTTRGTTLADGTKLGEECDILQIKIRGVDPKAIYNFSFNVAPLHYYSGTFENVDYVATFNEAEGNFGVKFGDGDFMNNVVNAPSKIGLPVGAGPYMASNRNGQPATSATEFFYMQSRVYYERNPYFETVGSGLNNVKIKYMQYNVVASDQMVNVLVTGDVDYSDPSATQFNIDQVAARKNLGYERVLTSGYGYVGINPTFVPNINIRRAIMKAMDTSIIFDDYYPNGLAEPIYRSMSKANWAFPEGTGVYEAKQGTATQGGNVSYAYDDLGDTIEAMVKAEGYVKGSDGVYQKNDPRAKGGVDKLEYTFTIAGASTDHPAYSMFLKAKTLLNKHGFNIKVETRQTALSDLNSGLLTVWAAAWTSTVDPDLYQVYHKDSNASSTRNWGYNTIKANKTGYATEWAIIQSLSTLIEQGRAIDNREMRIPIYAQALDLIMELAVEFPTYQRSDLFAYNADLLDRDTMTAKKDLGPYNGLLSRIWEVNYK